MIQWVINAALKKEGRMKRLNTTIAIINFAAMHTTATVLTSEIDLTIDIYSCIVRPVFASRIFDSSSRRDRISGSFRRLVSIEPLKNV